MIKQLLFLSFLLTSTLSIAQKDSTQCPCCTADYRAFDFWLGSWEVHDSAGTKLGSNIITLAQDGCALVENWTGAKGFKGTSLSFYHKATNKWHQSWIDGSGGSIIMDGVFKDGKMVLYTEPILNPKTQKEVINKTSWTLLEDGRVLHQWEVSSDNKKTWVTVFKGYYSK